MNTPSTDATSTAFLARRLAAWRLSASGFAAVEFALILPIMISLFLGAVEFSMTLSLDRRVTTIASATADLVAQSEQISSADLDDIMTIANSLLAGAFPSAGLEIKLVSVVSDEDNNVTVDWSRDKAGAEPYTNGTPFTSLPAGLMEPLTSLVVAEVSYDYDPPIGKYIVGSVNLTETFYLRPRKSLKVTKSD